MALFLPSALLVAGVYAVKPEFVPYAVAVAGILSGLAFLRGGSGSAFSTSLVA